MKNYLDSYYNQLKKYDYCVSNEAIDISYSSQERYIIIDNSGFPENKVFYNETLNQTALTENFTEYTRNHYNALYKIVE